MGQVRKGISVCGIECMVKGLGVRVHCSWFFLSGSGQSRSP
jgi:hypothetical protein